jgi:dipeptide/tripeptide permease
MEQVETESRAMVASLNSMVHSFGRAFSPIISGWLQVRYGFGPSFVGTISLYILAVILYYLFFWRNRVGAGRRVERPVEAVVDES